MREIKIANVFLTYSCFAFINLDIAIDVAVDIAVAASISALVEAAFYKIWGLSLFRNKITIANAVWFQDIAAIIEITSNYASEMLICTLDMKSCLKFLETGN